MKKVVIGIWIILAIYFICSTIVNVHNTRKENRALSFDGVVESVTYDIKDYPTVIVNSKKYYLGANYNFNREIEQGDSMTKQRGSSIYRLVKNKTGQVLYFNNE